MRESENGAAPPATWGDLDATAQAELVARGEATPRELVAAACERIERCDGAIGAVPIRYFEQALREANEAPDDAPYRGVPFLMKDVGARQAGRPYYAGNRALRDIDYRAASDTPLGARFREVGLVPVGNSSSPEFGLQSNTWPATYGPTHNPWNPLHAAGGSSGGACAAVAAGLVPVAHASDGAGSIRIPAAWCGLVGLKPTRDRVIWRHAGQGRPDVEFVVARSLRDTAAFLDLLRPRFERAKLPAPYSACLREQGVPAERLRVGFVTMSPSGTPVAPACLAAVRAAVDCLADAGHDVGERMPPPLFEYEERALYGVVLGPQDYRDCLAELAERLGREVTADDVEPFLWTIATIEPGPFPESELERSREWARAWTARLLAWFDSCDLLVTPTVHEPAPLLETLDPSQQEPLDLLAKMVPHMAFTEPWNATGQPAISLPLAQDENGLPVGVQVVAAIGREDHLFTVAALLERGLCQEKRRPALRA